MAPVAFSALGATAKDLLYGGKAGKFQYDRVLNLSSKTADGVDFTVSAVAKEDRPGLDMAAKAAYAASNYTLLASLAQSGKVSLAAAAKDVAPGLTLGLTGTVPDADSGKLSVDYSHAHVATKASISLTAAPKVDVAATTGVQGVTLGGEASYDTAKSAVTKWTVGAGYTGPDYQAALLLNSSQAATLLVAHKVAPDTTIGAEVARDLAAGTTTFAAGVSKQLEGGALSKFKLGNDGTVSVLYEQEIKPRTKLAVSGQFSALDLNKPPKFGFGYDIKY